MEIVRLADPDAVAAAAAAFVVDWVSSAPAPTLGLAGGSTPKATYAHLALTDPGWERVTAWLGDERWVPPDDPESNTGMVRASLTDAVPLRLIVPDWYRGHPHDAAAAYEGELDAALGSAPGLVMLGIGDDGHTASLFPGTAALGVRDRRYVANWVPSKGVWRLTATFPLLWSAEILLFLVTGATKAEPLRRIIDEHEDLPAGVAARGTTRALWFIDEAAASQLRDR